MNIRPLAHTAVWAAACGQPALAPLLGGLPSDLQRLLGGLARRASRRASALATPQGPLSSFLPSGGEHGLLRRRGAALPQGRAPLL